MDNEELKQVSLQVRALKTHEEVRGDILQKMFNNGANLVRTERTKINAMLIAHELKLKQGATRHFICKEGEGGDVPRQPQARIIPGMRVPDPSGWQLRVPTNKEDGLYNCREKWELQIGAVWQGIDIVLKKLRYWE